MASKSTPVLRRRLAILVGFAAIFCCLQFGWATAQDTELRISTKAGKYDDVKFELQNAIVGRGLVVDSNGLVGKMLDRTGADIGGSRPIYKQAEYFAFCSAKLSRATMEADPANLGFCPYVIFIYETAAAPGTIHVGYRRLTRRGLPQSVSALGAVETLLSDIVKDAVQ